MEQEAGRDITLSTFPMAGVVSTGISNNYIANNNQKLTNTNLTLLCQPSRWQVKCPLEYQITILKITNNK